MVSILIASHHRYFVFTPQVVCFHITPQVVCFHFTPQVVCFPMHWLLVEHTVTAIMCTLFTTCNTMRRYEKKKQLQFKPLICTTLNTDKNKPLYIVSVHVYYKKIVLREKYTKTLT